MMSISRTESARCVVVGGGTAHQIAAILSSSNVSTQIFQPNMRAEHIVDMCAKHTALDVVAVYSNDFSDGGAALLRKLKEQLPDGTVLYAVRAGALDGWDGRLREAGATHVRCEVRVQPVDVARAIKQTWFPKGATTAVKGPSKLPPAPAPAEEFLALRKNDPLPETPVVVNLAGLHGRDVQVDPRRLKALPGQPRSEHNPGFSEANLRKEGESIREFGQMETVRVVPLVGDPVYDGMIIDGEVRQRSCKLMGLMVWVSVREDLAVHRPKDLFLMAVISNNDKNPHTPAELVQIVTRLRAPESEGGYGFTQERVGKIFKRSTQWVTNYEMLGRLDREVLNMMTVDDAEGAGETGHRPLTQVHALLLVGLTPEQQRAGARKFVEDKLSYLQARQYALELKLKERGKQAFEKAGRGRDQAGKFDSLRTHVSRWRQQLQLFRLIPVSEFYSVRRTNEDREEVAKMLRDSAREAIEMAELIEGLPKD